MNRERLSAAAFLFLLSLFTATGWAQTDSLKNKMSFGMNFMLHGETCVGGLPKTGSRYIKADDHSRFLLGRLRLNADYERNGLQLHAVIQNKAVWGTGGNTAMNLYEGWTKMSAKNGLFAQLGRVALAYDDERIIGPNDFAMAALSHDVALVGYEGHGHKVHAIFAYNQNADSVYVTTYYDNESGAQYYKTMQTLWYHYDLPKTPLGVSLLFMNVGLQAGIRGNERNPDDTKYQQMWGGYINYHPKHLTIEGSYYRQTGKQVNNLHEFIKINAWMAAVQATVSPTDKYGFKVGYDYLSGDDYIPVPYGGHYGMVHHKELKGFCPLFGSRSKFYGILDYFYQSAYIHGFTPGLQKLAVGAFFNPTSKLTCSANYNYLAVATTLTNLNSTLGHSIDVQATYNFTKDISLTASYTGMIGTETMARLKQDGSSKRAGWGWFSLVISPSLFSLKW